MNQPSFTRSFGNGPSQVYKQSASSSRPIEVGNTVGVSSEAAGPWQHVDSISVTILGLPGLFCTCFHL